MQTFVLVAHGNDRLRITPLFNADVHRIVTGQPKRIINQFFPIPKLVYDHQLWFKSAYRFIFFFQLLSVTYSNNKTTMTWIYRQLIGAERGLQSGKIVRGLDESKSWASGWDAATVTTWLLPLVRRRILVQSDTQQKCSPSMQHPYTVHRRISVLCPPFISHDEQVIVLRWTKETYHLPLQVWRTCHSETVVTEEYNECERGEELKHCVVFSTYAPVLPFSAFTSGLSIWIHDSLADLMPGSDLKRSRCVPWELFLQPSSVGSNLKCYRIVWIAPNPLADNNGFLIP